MMTRAILAIAAVALVWTAVAFAAVAAFLALTPEIGAAWAAALTALSALVVLGVGVVLHLAFARPLARPAAILAPAHANGANSDYMPELARLAKDHPFIAVGCAALLGVAESIHSGNRR